MLAGRKLLLADDSVTIQKIIDLTFADEGVEVITVGDGEKAIEKVEQLLPDIVLADVYMPVINGYEVCEYIKGSKKLKHIPVMLLVGSFEPFDEAEARRVGANDTLTKPFQSIRRLIEKVGDLVNHKTPDSEVPTAELPGLEKPEEPKLSSAELEMVTADTLRLPIEAVHESAAGKASASAPRASVDRSADARSTAPRFATESSAPQQLLTGGPASIPVVAENKMETRVNEGQRAVLTDPNDTLLDLGDFEAESVDDEDFVLELDLDEPEKAPAPLSYSGGFAEPQVAVASAVPKWEETSHEVASMAATQPELHRGQHAAAAEARFEYEPRTRESQLAVSSQGMAPTSLNAESLSPELIDAIARRAVELMSDKVVREIAWEVVPQLAELLIRRQLEEKESQPK